VSLPSAQPTGKVTAYRLAACQGSVQGDHALRDRAGIVHEVQVLRVENRDRPPVRASELLLRGVGVAEGQIRTRHPRPARRRRQTTVEVAQGQARSAAVQVIEAVLGDDAGEVVAAARRP